MYQALLTRRYMTSKVMPLLAALAVMLCSAMVLVVWSVMGGFLVTFLSWGRSMEADVTISWPTIGFAHYEELIDRLKADPEVKAACPMIETFGMITLPDNRRLGVQIKGIDARYANVTGYADALWWKPIQTPLPKDEDRFDPRLTSHAEFAKLYQDGLALTEQDPKSGVGRAAAVLGIELSGFSLRQPEGFYRPADGVSKRTTDGRFENMSGFICDHSVTLNVIPSGITGASMTPASRRLPVANEFRTGLYEIDKNTVYVQLNELQRMLKMEPAEKIEASGDAYEIQGTGSESVARRAVIGTEPGRVTTVLVKAKEGVDSETLRTRCLGIYETFSLAHADSVPSLDTMVRSRGITTFERSRAMFIGVVKKEIALVLSLLMFISFVAVFLILAIFWSMVSEKTKDIGVLRAIGAGRAGVAWLWLRYGVSIGVTGAVAGTILACTVVWNINPIHEWMGRALGIVIWDPAAYMFTQIPNQVIPWKAALVAAGAVVFSVLGALIPAVKAAWMDPVRSLRFE